MKDFMKATEEISPEFGIENSKLNIYTNKNLFNYGKWYQNLMKDSLKIVNEINKN